MVWQGINQGCPFWTSCDLLRKYSSALPWSVKGPGVPLMSLVPFPVKARIYFSQSMIQVLYATSSYALLLSHDLFLIHFHLIEAGSQFHRSSPLSSQQEAW